MVGQCAYALPLRSRKSCCQTAKKKKKKKSGEDQLLVKNVGIRAVEEGNREIGTDAEQYQENGGTGVMGEKKEGERGSWVDHKQF